MDLREKIIEIISTNCEMENVNQYLNENDDLTKLGMNSISFIKMIVEMEKEFDFEFEDEALDYNKFTSMNLLCDYVKEMMRKNNVVYSPEEKAMEKTDEMKVKTILIQMISKITDSSQLNNPFFNDLSDLSISMVDIQSLLNDIEEKFNVSLNEDIIKQERLYLLDNLCNYIKDKEA